ncbi:hypothetical protein CR105_26345 [Massilia eurypsychrophila]|uniref:TnsA endonuclease N-terminal domain-containing protein n=2 Tax=Massilia eurypsychrophila TaxID=1485217 RepID=A0A2G8T7L2_9BURK|nr:hypothetical protein CR105_26345 [Massilia eurypsychrophila]
MIAYAMTTQTTHLPFQSDISRQVAVFPVLKRQRQHQSNIWFFDSPKNNERLTIATDLAFMHLVLLEGDTSVLKYVPVSSAEVAHFESREHQPKVGAQVYRSDGTTEWWNFKRLQLASGRPKRDQVIGDPDIESAARASGASYHVKTDQDLADKEILFDNWLTLCAAITRCRTVFLGREADIFAQRMALQRAVTLENLLTIPGIDVACMLAVVARALQREAIRANLKAQIFGRATLLSAGES